MRHSKKDERPNLPYKVRAFVKRHSDAGKHILPQKGQTKQDL